MSYVDGRELEIIIDRIESEFGKETPLSVHRGKLHDYLGMTIGFSDAGKVFFSMHDYIKRMLSEAPADLMKGSCTSPAAHHLFAVNTDATKLDTATAILYHHITAQLLYLGKRTKPGLLLATPFFVQGYRNPIRRLEKAR